MKRLDPRSWWPRCRRALYVVHRWLGIACCGLFAMWFVSGLVMMYVGYPVLTDAERLAGLSPLRLKDAVVAPATALAALPATAGSGPPRKMSLEMLNAGGPPEPVWRIVDATGHRHVVSARDGRMLGPFNAAQAQAVGRAFSGQAAAHWAETLDRDQWTVPQGLDAFRPLHRIETGDSLGTDLYVSSRTAEVVRDTSRSERFWNWLGAVPHWIYFTPVRADPALWHDVVVWLAGVCIVSVVTGLVVGTLRVRPRERYRDGAVTPYRGWKAWHHVGGLLGGVFVFTWIVSGWLSMHPNGWLSGGAFDTTALTRYQQPAPTAPLPWPPEDALPGATELQLLWFDGQPLLKWRAPLGRRAVVDARTGQRVDLDAETIRKAAARLRPGTSIVGIERLVQDDAYWYSHHDVRPLPVWRVQFAGAAGTWAYIDPASGEVVGHSDAVERRERWLFNAPHRWDFPWLTQHRPAWDGVVGLLAAAGLTVSVSGAVIGWRRLRRPRTRPHRVTQAQV